MPAPQLSNYGMLIDTVALLGFFFVCFVFLPDPRDSKKTYLEASPSPKGKSACRACFAAGAQTPTVAGGRGWSVF